MADCVKGRYIIMSKTLSNILTVFKVARIVAKVVFILCIVGGAGCLVGLFCLPFAEGAAELFFEENLDLSSAYFGCIVGAITCAGEAVFAFLSERYFKNVLTAGTPFTLDGSKECFRLGVASLIVSAAISIVSAIVAGILLALAQMNVAEPYFSLSISLSTGLFFLFHSMIFKHGAELQKTSEETTQENFESQ